MERWRAVQTSPEYPPLQDQRKAVAPVASDDGGDEALVRTVVLGPTVEAPPASPAAEELLDTVVLGASDSSPPISSGDEQAASNMDTSLDAASGREERGASVRETDALPDTVVISPPGNGPSTPGQRDPERRAGGTGAAVAPPLPPATDDDLAETVVVGKTGGPPPPPPGRPGEPPGKKPRKDDDDKDDDIILETVIIRSGNLRENHKEE
jgi:hypothetical protein